MNEAGVALSAVVAGAVLLSLTETHLKVKIGDPDRDSEEQTLIALLEAHNA